MTVGGVPMHTALGTASIPIANLWEIKAFSVLLGDCSHQKGRSTEIFNSFSSLPIT